MCILYIYKIISSSHVVDVLIRIFSISPRLLYDDSLPIIRDKLTTRIVVLFSSALSEKIRDEIRAYETIIQATRRVVMLLLILSRFSNLLGFIAIFRKVRAILYLFISNLLSSILFGEDRANIVSFIANIQTTQESRGDIF